MTKRNYILLIVLLLSNVVLGQFVGKDDLSISLFYMQKQELDSAKKYIDLAATDDELTKNAKTWYYKGFIYKELYKNREKSNKTSPYRVLAVNSFKKVLSIDDEKEFIESTRKALKYLSSTLYNDAARLLNLENYELAQINYNTSKKVMLLINQNFDAEEIEFKLALASLFNRPSENGELLDSNQMEKLITLYLEILEKDPNNPSANYNLATIYYNIGAEVINNMEYDMNIEQLNKVQDYCVGIFLKGLPYMHKSYELKFRINETLMGLRNIYRGLNDMEKSDTYKEELRRLEEQEH